MSTARVIHPDGQITEVSLKPAGSHLDLMREHLGCSLVGRGPHLAAILRPALLFSI